MISMNALAIMLQGFIGKEGMAQIQKIVEDGHILRIEKFANELEELNDRFGRIEMVNALILKHMGYSENGQLDPSGDGQTRYGNGPSLLATPEPDASSGRYGPDERIRVDGPGVPGDGASSGRSEDAGAASADADEDRAVSAEAD